ncbi:lipopolysaccharide biosynthesis protein [Micromonospora sp. NPDC003776]
MTASARAIWSRLRTRSFREFSWLSVNSQLSSVLSLLTTVLLARTVPLAEVGQVAFAQSVAVLIFLVLDPRFEDAVQRYVPLLRGESEARARAFFWRLLRWDVAMGLGVLALAWTLWWANGYPAISACRPEFLALALSAVGLGCALGTLGAGFAVTGGLASLGRLSFIGSLATAGVTAVATLRFGAAGYLAGAAIGAAVQVALLLPYCVRHLGLRALRAPLGGAQRALPPGLLRFIVGSSLSASLAAGTESGMLTVAGLGGGPELVAVLRIAGAPGRILLALCSPISAQAFPRLAALAAAGEGDQVRRLVGKLLRLILPVAVLSVAAGVLLMRPALGLTYGRQYEAVSAVAILFVVAGAIRMLIVWSKVLPLAVGRPGLRLASVAGESIPTIVAAFAIPRLASDVHGASLGIAGAAVAVAAGLGAFWIWLAGRRDLLRRPEPRRRQEVPQLAAERS